MLVSVRQQHQEQDHTTNNNERADNDKSRERPCKSKSRRGPPKDDEESDGYKSVDHDVSKSTHGSPPSTQQIDL